jgi:hypothetical protein
MLNGFPSSRLKKKKSIAGKAGKREEATILLDILKRLNV